MLQLIIIIVGAFIAFSIFKKIASLLGAIFGGLLGWLIGGIGIAAMGTAIGIPAIGVIIILVAFGALFGNSASDD